MKKLKIYLDTSVISHLQVDDVPEKMDSTLKFWQEIKQEKYDIILSSLVLDEVGKCPEPKLSKLIEYLREIKFANIEITEDIEILAQKYIDEKIIPEKYDDDAVHIAAATINNCEVILSWNFKHMVKYKTIIGVNGINKYMGYRELEIMTPESIIWEEE